MTGHDAATDDTANRGVQPDLDPDLEYGQSIADASRVGRWERAASVVLGGALVARGLRRRSLAGAATAAVGGALLYRGVTGRSRLHRALENASAGRERSDAETTSGPAIERSITVTETPDELESYWRDPDRVTRLVGDVADVSIPVDAGFETDDIERHRWEVDGPFGRHLEWETELVDAESGESLRWETLEGAPIPYTATIRFEEAPGDRGTEVTLRIDYEPPGGVLGDATMQRLGVVPATLVGEALGRFKSLAETGEIPSLEENPSARGKGDLI